MSLIFCDGFDDGLTLLGKWQSFNGPTIGPSYGRNGSGMRLLGNNNVNGTFVTRLLAAADEHATMTVGVAYRRVGTAASNTSAIITLCSDNGVTQHMNLRILDDGSHRLVLYRGNTAILADTISLLANQWYYLELKATLGDSPNGSYEVRVNGVTRMQATGTDTKNAGTKTVFDSVLLSSGIWSSGQEANLDDVYVTNGAGSVNTGFMGDIAIETIYPDSNGNSSQFVGSDADSVNNYQLVDETTPSTADFVGSATVGNKDTYSMGNLVRTVGAVNGVMVSSYAFKTDSGVRTIKNIARSGGTEVQSAQNALTTTWTPVSNTYDTDPNGGGNWTISSVNNAEFGFTVDT